MKGANQPWCPATLLGAWAMVVLALAGCAREDDRHPASTLRLLYDGDERQMFAGLRFPT